MDTKWTKFKENNFTKALCVIIACIMLVLACNSGLKVARYLYCFGNISGQNTFVDSHSFEYLYRQDIEAITQSVLYNKREKDIESERERGAEEFLAEYKAYKEKYDLYVEQEQNAATYYDEYDENGNYLTTVRYEYVSEYFSTSININILGSIHSLVPNEINCSADLTDDEVKNVFLEEFDSSIKENTYCSPEELKKRNIKNILYYAEADDGTVVTNTSGKEEVLSKATDDNKYLFYENGQITDNANNIVRNNFTYASRADGMNVYIVINNSFEQEDHYKDVFDVTMATASMNVEKFIAETVIYGVLALIFFIITMCLAGHKDGEKRLAPIDKLPYDIHLAVSGGLVTLCIIGFFVYISNYFDYLYLYDPGMHFETPIGLLKKPYYPLIPNALTVLAYLFTAEFFTSLARGIKAKTNIFKNTFIYIFCAFIVKMVVKFFKALKKFIKGIVYKPKHFDRKTTAAIVLYTLFNIVSALLVVLTFNSYIFVDGFFIFGILYGLGVLALDGYIVYLVMKYLKELDKIITAVENGEPTSDNAENLPNSLKILANSYDIANANLQSAIVKAVKDERTKAELITNVSHDLKTPLTSVINYIDLLQKCNIEDETAREYMGVIAEKSGKLKRLIEDLIEASKISSGNVTINKTKLNLNELAAQAIVEEAAEFEKRDLQLIFEEPANKHIAFADGTKIYRVLENLLSNAKKYSAPGSRIYARLYSGTDCEYFEIKNISKEQLNISAQELTERFVRGDKSRNEDGNGLGLSIATELCRLNGGELILSIDGDLFKATVKIPKE